MIEYRLLACLAALLTLGACSAALQERPAASSGASGETRPDAARQPAPAAPADFRAQQAGDPPAVSEGRSVFFAPGSADLDAAARAALEPHAARLRDDSRLVVTLVGYTDPLGSRSYNLALIEQRVSAVARALRSMDVKPQQIRRHSLGRENAGPACQSESCRRKLLRVDLEYSSSARK